MFNDTTMQSMMIVFVLSTAFTYLVKGIAIKLGLYAQENNRTIHHGKIPRIGGVAIYASFIAGVGINWQSLHMNTIIPVIIGMTIMFLTGLVDDICDLSAKTKLVMQVIVACVLVGYGIKIDTFRLPFGIVMDFGLLNLLLTIIWVVGITNAINLIDGLDGLAGGMGSTILVIISLTAMIEGKTTIMVLSLIMVSSLIGFLIYNSHPASIFMGDSGSLTLGFFIASLSLMGFKSATVMTLALPILILFLPITDTISAIIRRSLKHQKFSVADKSHLHHQLMRRFGQTKSVLIMCGITACFGLSAYVYMINKEMGILIMLAIIMVVEIFIEWSGMISDKFHPILSLFKKIKSS